MAKLRINFEFMMGSIGAPGEQTLGYERMLSGNFWTLALPRQY